MVRQERAIATRESIVSAGARLFGSRHYESVRITDLLQEASVTQGGFYFHFQGKKEVAEELIRGQEAAFVALRDEIVPILEGDPVAAILRFGRGAAELLRDEPIVRAGMRLVIQASEHFPESAHMPHPSWVEALETAMRNAVARGSLPADTDADVIARSVIFLFIGAQVSSFINEDWQNFPETVEATLMGSLGHLIQSGGR